MRSSIAAKMILTLGFLAIIFAEGMGQAFFDMQRGERIQTLDLFRYAPNEQNLRAFEQGLEKNSWQAAWIRPMTQFARYLALGDLGAKVLAGRDGWLFYRPGVDYLVQRWPAGEDSTGGMNEPLDAIVDFRDALADRDITLLVLVAPGKASVYPDKLSARTEDNPAAVRSRTSAFMEQLENAGIPAVDLFDLLGETHERNDNDRHYLALDTHWSPAGVEIAAQAVAERIRNEGWVSNGDTVYEAQTVEVEREGDLIRMVDSPAIAARFPFETVACQQILDTATGELYADDPESPILVLGDSFLRIYQRDEPGAAGFIAHLAHVLGQPMASIVNDGGASTLVRQELSRKPALLQGKKLVIWEFVERDLRFGMEGWQTVALPGVSYD